jgi:spermidine synthase
MGRMEDFLIGKEILEKVTSSINGELIIIRDLNYGTYIKTGQITQSGGIAQEVWKIVFNTLGQKYINDVLIVGLGGGGIAKLVSKNWPKAKMTGIEIDPMMIELGKKYLELDKLKVNILIEDGLESCAKLLAKKHKFDLICVDTYIGDSFPKKFESNKFLNSISKLLDKKGIVIFNRLYYMEKIQDAHKFQQKLEKIFKNIEVIKPEANIMFVCSHS